MNAHYCKVGKVIPNRNKFLKLGSIKESTTKEINKLTAFKQPLKRLM